MAFQEVNPEKFKGMHLETFQATDPKAFQGMKN